jgi:hypothetical protein
MNYIQKAKDYAVQWSVDRKGEHEFVFDQVGLEYFLDSLNIDFLAEQTKKELVGLNDEEVNDILKRSKNAYDAAKRIEAKLKEKNGY